MKMGMDVIAANRMHKNIEGTRIDMSLFLLKLDNSTQNKNIFYITKLGHMLIKIRTPEDHDLFPIMLPNLNIS